MLKGNGSQKRKKMKKKTTQADISIPEVVNILTHTNTCLFTIFFCYGFCWHFRNSFLTFCLLSFHYKHTRTLTLTHPHTLEIKSERL